MALRFNYLGYCNTIRFLCRGSCSARGAAGQKEVEGQIRARKRPELSSYLRQCFDKQNRAYIGIIT